MPWLYKMEKKFGKYAIPNLTMYLIILYAIGYVLEIAANMGNGATASLLGYLTLDIYAILHGQVWRLVTWLLIPPGSFSVLTLVVLYCYYNIGNMLERTWGTFRYNLFMLSGIIFTVFGAFILYGIILLFGLEASSLEVVSSAYSYYFSTSYVSMSIFLAFAITYPEVHMLFMFVIPIKTKVLGIIYVVVMAYQIVMAWITGDFLYAMTVTIPILFSLLNVWVFFIFTRKSFRTPTQIIRQHEYQKKRRAGLRSVTRHKCAICGRTEETDPDEEFRFCSKCDGNYEYCSKHIYTHTHIKKREK